MRVRISRTWRFSFWSIAEFQVGQVFDVRPSLAMYLFALGCAEQLDSAHQHGHLETT